MAEECSACKIEESEIDEELDRAVEASRDGESTKALIMLFKDKSISLCTKDGVDEHSCYHIESKPDNEKLYYTIQDWFSSLNFKIKNLTE